MKHPFSTLPLLLLTALLGLTGCMTTGGGNNLNARVDRHEQQIQTLLSQVGQVEQVLPGQAEMWSQMQTMRQELNMLHGKIDESQGGGVEMLRERVNRMEVLLRRVASQLGISADGLSSDAGSYSQPTGYSPQSGYTAPPAAGNTPVAGATTGGATLPPASSATPPANTADALYDAGIKAFDQRRYKDAVVSFKDFVATYPKHNLTGNAHFWQGEAYYQMKDYARAALAYHEVITKFPGSAKMQSAMLKQGMSLYNADKKAAGRERLQELVKRYPNSPEASRAKQFLAQNA